MEEADNRSATQDASQGVPEGTTEHKVESLLGSKEEDYVWFWKPEQTHGWASQWYSAPFEGPSRLPFEPPGKEVREIVLYALKWLNDSVNSSLSLQKERSLPVRIG